MMYTTEDMDLLFPGDGFGTLYRELYKEHHGEWPRDPAWESPEDFLEEFDRVLEDDWSDSNAIEDDDDMDVWDIINDSDHEDIFEDLGYDIRMNPHDEWD
jgi:hypothetical protein